MIIEKKNFLLEYFFIKSVYNYYTNMSSIVYILIIQSLIEFSYEILKIIINRYYIYYILDKYMVFINILNDRKCEIWNRKM